MFWGSCPWTGDPGPIAPRLSFLLSFQQIRPRGVVWCGDSMSHHWACQAGHRGVSELSECQQRPLKAAPVSPVFLQLVTSLGVLQDSLQHSLRRGWCGCGSGRPETRPAHPGDWEHGAHGIQCWLLSVVIHCAVATKGWSRNVAIRVIQLFSNLHFCASMENSFVLICGVFSCFKIQWPLSFRFCLIFMFLVSLCRAGTFKSHFFAIFGKGQMCILHDLGSIALKAPFLLVGVFWVMN